MSDAGQGANRQEEPTTEENQIPVGLVEELRIEGAIVPNRRGELYRLAADEIEHWRALDSEAAHHIEMVIINRSSHFTGEPPYVGWPGLGRALRQDYSDLDALKSTADDGCICKGNWRLIVKEYQALIDRRYKSDEDGKIFRFYGIVHASDDYYYGMYSKEGGDRLLSCVGSLESYGYTLIPEPEVES